MLTCLAASVLSVMTIFSCEMTMQDRAYKVKKLDFRQYPSILCSLTMYTNKWALSYRWQRKEEWWVSAEQIWPITSHQSMILWNTCVIYILDFKGYFLLCYTFWNIKKKQFSFIKLMKVKNIMNKKWLF